MAGLKWYDVDEAHNETLVGTSEIPKELWFKGTRYGQTNFFFYCDRCPRIWHKVYAEGAPIWESHPALCPIHSAGPTDLRNVFWPSEAVDWYPYEIRKRIFLYLARSLT